MGTFTIGCLIKNQVDREKSVKIPRIMVDTGADATWIPRKLLEQIEIKVEKRLAYQMADGQYVYRDVGYALIRVGGRETADEFVFAEKGDRKVLGPRALTGLGLWVDPTNKKLIEIEAHPAARADARKGYSTLLMAPRKELQCLGSATVPVAAGRVSRPAPWLFALHRNPDGRMERFASAFRKQGERNVFGETPNTAGGTPALPGIAVA